MPLTAAHKAKINEMIRAQNQALKLRTAAEFNSQVAKCKANYDDVRADMDKYAIALDVGTRESTRVSGRSKIASGA